MNSLFKRKISLPYFLLFTSLTIAVTLMISSFVFQPEITSQPTINETTPFCDFQVERMSGYKFIRPLLFADKDCESSELKAVKTEMNTLIEAYKASKGVRQASVYLRDYNQTAWTCINPLETYEPGSLAKVPVLLYFLKMNEKKPGLLDKKITYSSPIEANLNIAFKSESIVLGKQYTIRELLRYMIVYSDNKATVLLDSEIIDAELIQVFRDLRLPIPDKYAAHYYLNVSQYSMFLRTIYNGNYLSKEDSEFAAEMLAKVVFKDGMRRAIPAHIPMAHKFGEAGTDQEKQLHESAIVYLDKRPFLLTIMTKGKDLPTLSTLIQELTQIVYKNMSTPL